MTGGAGFIGSHLVEALVAQGARVTVLDDFSTGKRENLAAVEGRIELCAGSLLDAGLRRRACAGVDWVFHLAALTSAAESMVSAERARAFDAVNRTGSLALFADATAAGAGRVLFASSAAVYGGADGLAVEGKEGAPLSPYAAAKAAAEQGALHAATPLLSLRLFNVYGPRQDPGGPYAAVVPAFLSAARAGRPATVYGDGTQSRDFVHVADVVAAFLAAARARATGEAVNVGSGRATTIRDLASTVRSLFPGAPPPLFAEARPGEVVHSRASVEKARRLLGWSARVGLRDGLATTAAAFA